ncbi:hypothetical protein [Streptomyces vinaceus]|uniref:hypothetical protein n=1 Tax=Streptomyces vinaceus TaxID=1960 RepID=UPI00367B4DD5
MSDFLDQALVNAPLGRVLHDRINRHLADGEQAEKAVARVRALHRPVEHRGRIICAECSAYDGHSSTDNPPADHPCPTINALQPPKETQS